MRLCSDPDCDLSQVARVLTTDAALSAEVMRLANSPGFGARREVAELGQAVSMVGVKRLGQIATAMAMLGAFRCDAEKALPFHHTSLLSGAVARQLAGRLSENQSTAFLLGLLCEIGAMACAAVDAQAYAELYHNATGFPARWDAEMNRYEASSPALGAELLRRNGLPEEICDAIGALSGREAPSQLGAITAFTRELTPTLQGPDSVTEDVLLPRLLPLLEAHTLGLEPTAVIDVLDEAIRLSASTLQR